MGVVVFSAAVRLVFSVCWWCFGFVWCWLWFGVVAGGIQCLDVLPGFGWPVVLRSGERGCRWVGLWGLVSARCDGWGVAWLSRVQRAEAGRRGTRWFVTKDRGWLGLGGWCGLGLVVEGAGSVSAGGGFAGEG